MIVVDKFVARENIRHFRDRLETDTDPTTRSCVAGLLLQELDKLGHDGGALREIDSHIAREQEHVNRQQMLLASKKRDGHDMAQAVMRLNVCSDVLLAFKIQRNKILTKLQRVAF